MTHWCTARLPFRGWAVAGALFSGRNFASPGPTRYRMLGDGIDRWNTMMGTAVVYDDSVRTFRTTYFSDSWRNA